MPRVAPPTDKYFLRSLHQEIDFFDRKLAYLDKYADFANSADREEAEGKLLQEGAALEKTARELAAAGVEISESDPSRSFCAQGDHGKHRGEALS